MELDTKAASAAHPDVARARRQMVAFAKVAARAYPDFDFATARPQMAAYARAAEAMKDRKPASRALMEAARAAEAMKDRKPASRAFSMDADFIDAGSYSFRV